MDQRFQIEGGYPALSSRMNRSGNVVNGSGKSTRPACVDHRQAENRLRGAHGLVPAPGRRVRHNGTRVALWPR